MQTIDISHELTRFQQHLENNKQTILSAKVPADINNVSFTYFIASLSVRDIAHILDGVENQIEPVDVEIYNDYKIKSNDYITRFLSVLVRMKYKITYESLLDYFIEDYNWFKILNNYVLFARNSAGKVFSINSDIFTFHMTTTDFVYSITWHNPAIGPNSTVSIKNIAEKALDAAISRVKDGEQIIVDTIPLGELYLE